MQTLEDVVSLSSLSWLDALRLLGLSLSKQTTNKSNILGLRFLSKNISLGLGKGLSKKISLALGKDLISKLSLLCCLSKSASGPSNGRLSV
jgi:hypothetical protein